jgi:hypothetical protein
MDRGWAQDFVYVSGKKYSGGVCGVLQGFLQKPVTLAWCLGGESVVLSVVNVVIEHHVFWRRKMRQVFWIYFRRG